MTSQDTTPAAPAAERPDPRMDIYAAPQTLVKVNRRRRLNLHIAGEGGPTVILSSGMGGINLNWGFVHPYVARFARVVAHDHAGLAFSDPGPMPRTSRAIVADLRAALAAAGIAPPYVLAGHSAGGMHMRLFALLYPQEVAGLVLIDSVVDFFEDRMPGWAGNANDQAIWRNLLALARAGALQPGTQAYRDHVRVPQDNLTPAMNLAMHEMRTRPAYYRALISESRELNARSSADLAALAPSLGDLPLIVLRAKRVLEDGFIQGREDWAKAWLGMGEELAALSTRGVLRDVDCGHGIPIEQPRAVVTAIRDLVDLARA